MTVVITCFTNEQQNGTVVICVLKETGWSTVPGFYKIVAGAWAVLQKNLLNPMEHLMCLKNQGCSGWRASPALCSDCIPRIVVTKVVITNQFQELLSLKVKIYEDGPTELTSMEVN